MADPKGFLNNRDRELPNRRPVSLRLLDWKDVYERGDDIVLRRQAGRCMDCGIPFCHQGCPLGNLIPEWNDLVRRGEFRAAGERLHATNNFPELTGRLCPAPCESSCVLGISEPAVTIKSIEQFIADEAWQNQWVQFHLPERLTGKTVAIVGSGPAGLAAAQQLTRVGHTVVVYERDDQIGGLLRYGIPDFKLEKHILDNRLSQMEAEGTRFRTGFNVGTDIGWQELRHRYDSLVIATGSLVPKNLDIPGRELTGIHFAMDYLVQQNRINAGKEVPDQISAAGRHVVILGGGDTGADCLGTAHRQGALSVTTLAIGLRRPAHRPDDQPWPTHPTLFEVSTAHEEGGQREFLVSTTAFLSNSDGQVEGIRLSETDFVAGRRVPKPGTERDIPADLVLLALGFTGTDTATLQRDLNIGVDRGTIIRDARYQTNVKGVFAVGDVGRGQSLIVWAIAEGRAVAAAVDQYLEGASELSSPVSPIDRALEV